MHFMNRVVLAATLGVAALILSGSANAQTTNFTTLGFYDYTVGAGVTTLDISLAGAGGEGSAGTGGAGGLVTARLSGLSAGQVLRVIIGAGGGVGSGNGSGGSSFYSGGDFSAVALGSGTDLSALSYLLIAGGGGGGYFGNGGAGGGLTGEDGSFGAGGGTQSSGGSAGGGGDAGSQFFGGDGGTTGGGGGYFGGGASQGSAGGGSSFSSASPLDGINVSNVAHTQGGAENGGGDTTGGSGFASLTVVQSNGSAAPEPGTFALMGVGGWVLGLAKRRKIRA